MFIAELNLPDFGDYDLSSLRTGIMAGSPCPVEVMKRCINEMHMDEVTICYGMTETSPVSTQTLTDDPIDKRVSTVGRVHPHVEIKVIDEASGRAIERGQPGELCTRGYSVMLGYWGEPERTAEAIDAARWMHTGDLATMDEDGYLNIVGRLKDLVIRGGENVYPREVEEFLYTHPDIVDVQVIGVPDAKYGEEIMAWIKVRAGAEPLTVEAVREFCQGRIAHYKIPRYVHLTEEFPMTITGKVQKFKMREDSIDLLGLQAAAGIETA
jgi:fatty-acyl-CoA synthase